MSSIDFQQLVACIRKSFKYSAVGLSLQDVQQQNKQLDSDAYSAAIAVSKFLVIKGEEYASN